MSLGIKCGGCAGLINNRSICVRVCVRVCVCVCVCVRTRACVRALTACYFSLAVFFHTNINENLLRYADRNYN